MSYQFTAGRFKGFAADGTPLAGGRLYTYASGTTTYKAAYTDSTLGTPCTYVNDGTGALYIALDARGEAQLWLGSGAYSFALKTSAGAGVWTVDGVRDQSDTAKEYTDALRFDLASAAINNGSKLVAFIRRLTGATGRTVEDKLQEIFTSEDMPGIVGAENTGLGTGVLASVTSGSSNTIVGFGAGAGITTSYGNTALGIHALSSASQSGDQNTAIGRFALEKSTTGYENVAVGTSALGGSTTGNINVAMGRKALLRNTTGHENTAIGTNAMGDEAQPGSNTGDGNTAIGRNTLKANTTGSSNTACGRSGLASNTTGTQNVAVGQSALVFATTGVDNVAVGAYSLSVVTTGVANVSIGTYALPLATSDRNTAVGNNALSTTTTGTNVIGIGDGVTATGATTSNEITLGNGSITNFRVPGIGLSAIAGTITFGGVKILVGSGTPEAVQTAPVGSMFLRTDGGAGTTLYIKQSGTGNTGWVGK